MKRIPTKPSLLLLIVLLGVFGALEPLQAQSAREAEIEFARGQLFLEMKDYPGAVYALGKAYDIQPDNRYLASLVVALYRDGQQERALILGEIYVERETEKPDPKVLEMVAKLKDEYSRSRGKVDMTFVPGNGKLELTSGEGAREVVRPESEHWVRWLNAGNWTLRYEVDGREPWSLSLQVEPGSSQTIEVRPERTQGDSSLTVVANVTAARVFIDGKEVGRTPLKARIASGDHIVQVWADDHLAWTGVVDAPAARSVSVRADLAPAQGAVSAIPVQTMDVRGGGGWSLSTWGWITMGTGLALGGGAGYFYYVMFNKASEAQGLANNDPRRDSLTAEVQTNWIAAVIMGAVGGVMLGGGLLMVLLDDKKVDEESTPFELLTLTPDPNGKGLFLDAAWSF